MHKTREWIDEQQRQEHEPARADLQSVCCKAKEIDKTLEEIIETPWRCFEQQRLDRLKKKQHSAHCICKECCERRKQDRK